MKLRSRYGFTLIEMVITLALVALLASMAVPVAELAMQRSKEQELRSNLRQIREAIDAYKHAADSGRIQISDDESGYPRTLAELVDGVEDAKSPAKTKLRFLRRIPRDPMSQDGSLAAEASWGKRSYLSAPDAPQAGRDVFDVYSLNPGKGLNGVPYREW